MSLNFLKSIEAEIPQLISLLQNDLLPALAKVEIAITPETTAADLTSTLESDTRSYLDKKLGVFVGELVFLVPSVKSQVDKAIAYVVDKALPVVQAGEKEEDNLTGIFAGGGVPFGSSPSSLAPTPASESEPANQSAN